MRLQMRFSVAFGAILALFVGLTTLFGVAVVELNAARELGRRTSERLALVERLLATIHEQESSLRGYLLSDRRPFLDDYESAPQRLSEQAAALEAVGDGHRSTINQIVALAQRWRTEFAEPVLALYRDGDVKALRDRIEAGRGRDMVTRIETLTDGLIAEDREALAAREAQLARRLDMMTIAVAVALAVAMLVLLGVVRTLRVRVADPMTALAASTRRLAAGEAAQIDHLDARDEIGDIARALDEFGRANRRTRQNVWIKTSVTDLTERLGRADDWPAFASAALGTLCPQLGAVSGALYRVEDDGARARCFGQWARGAAGGEADIVFAAGEGLVGEALRSHAPVRVTDLPPDYPLVRGGLGESRPAYAMAEPLTVGSEVIGVLEISGFRSPGEAERALLDEARSVLALALDSLDGDLRTRQLLDETRQQAQALRESEEELRAQQEELRASNDTLSAQTAELEEQGERLRASEEELRVQAQELREANGELQERSAALERASEEIARKSREVEQASRYKSEFLANMSHELRTPLNALLILARSLADNEQGNLDDDQIESARIIHESGQNLLRLINDVLDLSKIEAGRLEVAAERIAPRALFERLRREFEPMARSKGLAFQLDIDEALPAHIRHDGDKLRQIVVNLLGNAIKFTEQGEVALSVAVVAEGDAAQLSVAVRDSGIGMDAATAERVFRAFEQADSSTSRRYGGTGLGLAISRRLAELLGGSLSVESEPGAGACFRLRVPLTLAGDDRDDAEPVPEAAPTPVPSAPEPELERAGSGARPRLLIIEDDAAFARVVAKTAEGRGLEVQHAATGGAGLELARTHPPAGIVLDLGLPDMDGSAVVEALRADERTRGVPVHIISAADDAGGADDAAIRGFLRKPVTREDLDQVFARLLGTERGRRVLIVDDDAATRRALAKLLRGYPEITVDEAADGEAALAALGSGRRIGCMILDLNLPDIDGFELLDAIERNPDPPPVVVYSARELSEAEMLRLRGHTDSIVIKGAQATDRLLDEVKLFLHAVDRPRATGAAAASGGSADLDGRRVLIVDDDVRNVFALSKALRARGLDVVMQQDAARALELLATEDAGGIELVLMDIMMPGIDGYEAMRRIRADARHKQLPIIALTAKAMRGDREKCLEAGASDYLSKPVDVDKLVSMMRVWLDATPHD